MKGIESEHPSDPLVLLARRAIQTYIAEGRIVSAPDDLPPAMDRPAAVFVSIKKCGALRGCIGTLAPSEATLAAEIIANAIKSATADPRFPPVVHDELDHLDLSVDVLSKPEPCDASGLDPTRYGVIVESGWRRGLLLPDLPGVDSIDAQIEIAKRKAGIGDDEPCELRRFTVERHT